MRKIEDAPEPFKARLEDLKKRGLLDSPKLKEAIQKAVSATIEEQHKDLAKRHGKG
jgi:hypothetical protein